MKSYVKQSQLKDKARDLAGNAAKFAVASGIADTMLKRGMKMRRKVLRKKQPSVASKLVRGLLVASAVAGVAIIGQKLINRQDDFGQIGMSDFQPTPSQ